MVVMVMMMVIYINILDILHLYLLYLIYNIKKIQDYSFEGADIPLNYLAPLMQLLVLPFDEKDTKKGITNQNHIAAGLKHKFHKKNEF